VPIGERHPWQICPKPEPCHSTIVRSRGSRPASSRCRMVSCGTPLSITYVRFTQWRSWRKLVCPITRIDARWTQPCGRDASYFGRIARSTPAAAASTEFRESTLWWRGETPFPAGDRG